MFLLLALSLGFSFARSKKDALPTIAPSEAPSTVPSLEPTHFLEALLAELPKSTLDNIYNPSSHQRAAYEWMQSQTEIRGVEAWRLKQIFALATFFFSFGGPEWQKDIRDDWLDFSGNKSECHWFSGEFGYFTLFGDYSAEEQLYGIRPCNENGEFQALVMHELGSNDYNPTIPPELALLTKLRVLSLSTNGINSPLADVVPLLLNMTALSVLELSYHRISGTIPTQLGLFTALSMLDLSFNSITGSTPTELGLIQTLQELYLFRNFISGTIPTEVGLQTNLRILAMEDNRLTGMIPTEIGLQTDLKLLVLSNNTLTGTIPTELGPLILNGNLTEVDLYWNLLHGTIPNELCTIGSPYHFDCDEPLCGCYWCGCERNDTKA